MKIMKTMEQLLHVLHALLRMPCYVSYVTYVVRHFMDGVSAAHEQLHGFRANGARQREPWA